MCGLFRRRKPPEPEPSAPLPPADTDLSFPDGSKTTYITGDTRRDSDRIRLLIDSLRSVSSKIDADELLVSMVDRAVRTVGAERGMLFTRDPGGAIVQRVGRAANESDLPAGASYSSQVVESVLAGGESICKREDDGGDFDPSQSMINLDIRAVMCVPMEFQGQRQGVMYVDARASERLFARGDLRFFEAFADMLCIVWANRQAEEERLRAERMRRDLELVREIQGNLLPAHTLRWHGFSMCGRVIPADEAGGDYFDFFKTKRDRLAMAVGDVTGHGAGPSLFMCGARAYLRAYAQDTDSPRLIVSRLNEHLEGDMGDDMFMSMFVCVLDPETGELSYTNAGHPRPILYRAEIGEVEDFKRTGMALGVEAETDWDERGPQTLGPGDAVVMFSDGIIELRAGGEEQYGRQRLGASILQHVQEPPEQLLDRVLADALAWAGDEKPGQDDLTIAVLRCDS